MAEEIEQVVFNGFESAHQEDWYKNAIVDNFQELSFFSEEPNILLDSRVAFY